MSEQSQEIGKLAAALSKAQGRITGAVKDSENTFFHSNYADLSSVLVACRAALSENELAVIQEPESDDSGVYVITTLAHSSGEWMRSRLRLRPKDASPQSMGSAITYGRRYALAAMVGVAQVDDDGNAASGRETLKKVTTKDETQKAETPKGVTTLDPRGDDRPPKNQSLVDIWVNKIANLIETTEKHALAAVIYGVHTELTPDHFLYIDIGDELAEKEIISKGRWKELVREGNPKRKAA